MLSIVVLHKKHSHVNDLIYAGFVKFAQITKNSKCVIWHCKAIFPFWVFWRFQSFALLRKALVLSLFGLPKTSSGVPNSSITPSAI